LAILANMAISLHFFLAILAILANMAKMDIS